MTQYSEGGSRTLSAFFDSETEANRAVDRLEAAGIARASVRVVNGSSAGTVVEDRSEEHRGFFGALADFFFPDEDRYTYAEGLSRGGYLVVVDNLSNTYHDTALAILDQEGAVNLDEREETWRSEGWGGYSDEVAAGYAGDAALGGRTGAYAGTPTTSADAGLFGERDRTLVEGDSETIPVVDERLVVGKRDVNLGRVRVRSYVREEPVSADVNLHDERVSVERHAVDRPLSDADAAFRERTIEAEEHSEEAVIGKEARVTEEISLRKEGRDHTETVSDTVRKTDVEIDDERDVGASRFNQR